MTLTGPDQPVAAMLTGVVEGANLPVGLADGNDGFAQEIVHDPVAGFGQLGLPAGDVPHLRPHVFPLQPSELGAVVAITGYGVTAKKLRVPRIELFCPALRRSRKDP